MNSVERQQLDFAATQIRLHRKALADCVEALKMIYARDTIAGRRPVEWQRDGTCERALYIAEKTLKPKGIT